MDVERRLDELGLSLPAAPALPAGVEIPFAWVRVRGDRAFVAGHGALAKGPSSTIDGQSVIALQDKRAARFEITPP